MANRGSFGSSEPGYSYHAGGMSSARDNSNEFTRLSQVIANNIQKITQNVAQMQRLVNQIGMRQDSVELRDKLHQVQHYSNQLAKDTSKYLKDIAHLPTSSTPSEQRQRKMQRERLMNDFSSALNNFQAAQRLAAEKEKQSVARVRAHSGFSQDPFLDDRTSDDQLVGFDRVQQPFGSSNSPFDDVVSSQAQQVVQIEEDVDMHLLQEREQAIKQLESDITDVNQIFKDLAVLVHEQGDVIDSIEANVDAAAVHVDEGTQQLSKASSYQSKARRKKCVLLIILLVVLAVIAIIIAVLVKHG